MNADGWKGLLGVGLLSLWAWLVWAQVPHAEDLIGALKSALVALGSHYLTTFTNPPDKPAVPAKVEEVPK